MLSRLAMQSAGRSAALRLVAVRIVSTSAATHSAETFALKEGPERDLVNFPRPVRLEHPADVRIGIFPETWFHAMHKKTGVCGPYVFGLGLYMFLLSKEILVYDHELWSFHRSLLAVIVLINWFGPQCREYLDKMFDDEVAALNRYKDSKTSGMIDAIREEKKQQWHAEGQTLLFEAKKENVALQLEATFRERQLEVHNRVKRHLDYQVDTQNVAQSFQQKSLVEWVMNNVQQSITPQQEQDSIKQCMSQLKAISKTA